MIKRFLASAALLFLPLLLTAPAHGQVELFQDVCENAPSPEQRPSVCDDIDAGEEGNPAFGDDGIVTRAVNVLSIATGIIAVIVIVVAGIRMTLSQGDGQQISQIRSTLIYAVVGLATAVLAQAIVQLVLTNV